jgi:hypothetical protein
MVAFFEALMTGDWARLQGGIVELFATAVALLFGFLFRGRADKIAQSMKD